jgi:4-diphosphocytidyl-2-C-methyl-D-erythritol kinase
MLNSTISLADRLEVDFSVSQTSLGLSGERAAGISCSDNLVLKAVSLAETLIGEPIKCRIQLTKNIPSGAGLGGGSSDAAAMLRILFRCYGEKLWKSRESALVSAQSLGADVPFFLEGGLARVLGIGDEVQRMGQYSTLPVLLCVPKIPIGSSQFYAHLRKVAPELPLQPDLPLRSLAAVHEGDLSRLMHNDFEKHLDVFCPAVFKLIKKVRDCSTYPVALTGSGSVFFVIGSREAEFELLFKQLNDMAQAQDFNIIRSELSTQPSVIDFSLNPL